MDRPSSHGLQTTTAADGVPGEADDAAVGPGARVSRYVILKPLGTGGMGAVYLAVDPDLDRRVAIKIVRPGGAARYDEDGGRSRLLREAQAIAKLSHPNVIAIYDVGPWHTGLFLAMEFVEGIHLRAWVRERQRTVPEILEVFVRFGRGLAAAHRAGIVHRDVKPENVLVTPAGGVKVLDFGLARATVVPASEEPIDSGSQATAAMLHDNVTVLGRVMGTPIYMAPEQARGDPPTEKGDIYSFCVALYEAIYGDPPFRGRTMGELRRARLAGVRFPESRRIPKRLVRVIARGLAHDPTYRFADMESLVRELSGIRGRRRTVVRTAVVVAAATALFGVGRLRRPVADDPCAVPDDASGWSAARRAELEQAFTRSDLELAEHAWASVSPRLDGYALEWARERRDACEATIVRGERTGAEMDLRHACLDRARTRLEAVLATLESGDARALAGAIDTVGALPPIAACADLDALARLPPVPADPDLRARVDEIRSRLAELQTNRIAGRYAVADSARASLDEELRRVDDPAIAAEVAFEYARLDRALGRAALAETELRAALRAAEVSRHGLLRARIALELADQLGSFQKRFAAGEEALHHADAMIAGLGDPPELVARSRWVFAEILFARDQLKPARDVYEELLERQAPELEPDLLMQRIGDCLRRGSDARVWYERALALEEQRFGPAHPRTADTLLALSRTHIDVRDLDRAEPLARRALGIRMAVLGGDHPAVAAAWSRLGVIELHRERYGRAAEYLERAVAMITDDPRAIEFDGATILSNLGVVYGRRGEPERARAVHERALAMLERADPDHPRRSIPLINIASTYRAQGRPLDAVPYLEQVVEILLRLPESEARRGDMEVEIAEALLEGGEPGQAEPHATRALALYRLHMPARVALTEQLLAEIQAANGRSRARSPPR